MFGTVAKTHWDSSRRYNLFRPLPASSSAPFVFERSVKISRRRVRLHLEASDDTADAFLTLPLTLEQLKSLLLRSFPQNRLSDIVIVKGKNADNVAVLMILVICHVEKVEAFPPLFCALNKTKQKNQTECPVQWYIRVHTIANWFIYLWRPLLPSGRSTTPSTRSQCLNRVVVLSAVVLFFLFHELLLPLWCLVVSSVFWRNTWPFECWNAAALELCPVGRHRPLDIVRPRLQKPNMLHS